MKIEVVLPDNLRETLNKLANERSIDDNSLAENILIKYLTAKKDFAYDGISNVSEAFLKCKDLLQGEIDTVT